ncbi:hypothetical protein [Tellurirhabdus bombi]|uniref:hypothetical protein n=1 Tax=Tellurirhabdus bombi TaxID=2907205 RepID=UPI001F2D2A7A|nr:hypothetical protein [Tellurirhabdus bombi]
MRKLFIGFLSVVGGILFLLVGYAYHNSRDRHPGYALDLTIDAPLQAKPLQVGFSALKITPILADHWRDKNGNAAYEPELGDTYQDGNGNGRFDAYWMAGFRNRRAANGIHDDLWARAIVIDDGQTRLAIVALDLLGFSHKNVINVRKKLPARAKVNYAIVCSTHNHEAPDLLGLWGEKRYESGVNKAYEQFVEDQSTKAIMLAVKNLQPARLRFAQDSTGADSLILDTRKPLVKDAGIYIMQALAADKDTTLGTLVVWGNHPETLWDKNLQLTSDFPHYVREYLEKGIQDTTATVQPGLGGTVVYASGCVGGLMTTSPKVAVKDPVTAQMYQEPSFDKAAAEGKKIAMLVYKALQNDITIVTESGIQLRARTLELPLINRLFQLGVAAGILDMGYSSWGMLRTEIAAFQLGEASFLCVPGELYPEIANGGVESPPGADFRSRPLETPPLRSLMRGKYKFVLGLANDELGYIIPKSEWDEKEPYLYGSKQKPYGEINSVGPDTAPKLYQSLAEILRDL